MCNKNFQKSLSLIVLSLGILAEGILADPSLAQNPLVQTPIAKLTNGNYQFCSQPKPNDWRDGAGICLNFAKADDRIDGYYGYPHSDVFICIRGSSLNNTITGKALGISGLNQPDEVPQDRLEWDSEQRLHLGQGKVVRSINDRDDRRDWVLFQAAALNLQGFYQYLKPQMTPAPELCDWSMTNVPK
jgi:hypothetical protein